VWEEELENWPMTDSVPRSQDRHARLIVALLDCLQTRFPNDLTSDVIKTINEQPSETILRTWYRFALVANSFAEFVAALHQ
jgi:hypothetical protein